MRRGQNSPADKSQKRPARSLGTQEKVSSLSIMIQQVPTLLDPGPVEPIRVLHQPLQLVPCALCLKPSLYCIGAISYLGSP